MVNKVPEPPLPQLLLLPARVLEQLELHPQLLPQPVVPHPVPTELLLLLLSPLVALLLPLLPQPMEPLLLLPPLPAARALELHLLPLLLLVVRVPEQLPLLPLPLVARVTVLLPPLLLLSVAPLPLLVRTVLLPVVQTAPLLVAPQELDLQELELQELVPQALVLLVRLALPVLLPVHLDLLARLAPRVRVQTAPPTAPQPHLHLVTERPQVARAPRLATPTLLSLTLRRRIRVPGRLPGIRRMAMVYG